MVGKAWSRRPDLPPTTRAKRFSPSARHTAITRISTTALTSNGGPILRRLDRHHPQDVLGMRRRTRSKHVEHQAALGRRYRKGFVSGSVSILCAPSLIEPLENRVSDYPAVSAAERACIRPCRGDDWSACLPHGTVAACRAARRGNPNKSGRNRTSERKPPKMSDTGGTFSDARRSRSRCRCRLQGVPGGRPSGV